MPTKGNVLKKIKAIYEKPTANITINRENRKLFPLRYGTGRNPTPTTFIHHSTRMIRKSNQARKK